MKDKCCSADARIRHGSAYVFACVRLPKFNRNLTLDLGLGCTAGLINLGFGFHLGFEDGNIDIALPLLDLGIGYNRDYTGCFIA